MRRNRRKGSEIGARVMKEGEGGYCAEIGAIVMEDELGCNCTESGGRTQLRRNRRNSSESGAIVQKAAQLSNRQGRGVTSLSWHRR